LAQRTHRSHRYAFTDLVLTAATGFTFTYDASIKHITYQLEDRKSENASSCFDMAAFQIDKCKIPSMQT
jgi:hypothetical protein